MNRTGIVIFFACWAVCLVVAFMLDALIARELYARDFHLSGAGVMRSTQWAYWMKSLGDFRYASALIVLLVVVRALNWRHGALAIACSGISILSEPGKLIFGRCRPVVDGVLQSASDFMPLVLRGGGGSMPSGHAMLAFATAACLSWYNPRWALPAYLVATIVAAERVLEASHFLSDVVMSVGIAVPLTWWCLSWHDQHFAKTPSSIAAEKEEIPA